MKFLEAYRKIKEHLGIDLVADYEKLQREGRIRINLSMYDLQKAVHEIDSFFENMKYVEGLLAFNANLKHFLNIRQVETVEHLDAGYISKLNDYFSLVREMNEAYQQFSKVEYKDYLERFRKVPFFQEPDFEMNEKTLKLLERIPSLVETTINKKLFSIYNYTNNGDQLNFDDKIEFYPTMGIGEKIDNWIEFLGRQTVFTAKHPNTIFVTIFLRIDEVAETFSNFLITIHKGTSIWIATDTLGFDNPYNKIAQAARGRASGKLERVKESHYENIGLPYYLAYEFEEIQQGQIVKSDYYDYIDVSMVDHGFLWGDKRDRIDAYEKEIAEKLREKGVEYTATVEGWDSSSLRSIVFKKGGFKVAYLNVSEKRITVYKKASLVHYNLNKLERQEKFYFVLLVDRILENIVNLPPQKTLMMAKDFVNQKMLGTTQIDPSDEGFSNYTDAVRAQVEELLEGSDHKETGLMKMDYSMVLSTKYYDSNMLATVDQLQNHVKWNVIDTKRAEIQKGINKVLETKKEDVEKLKKLFEANIFKLYAILYSGDEINLERVRPKGGFDDKGQEPKYTRVANRFYFEKESINNYRSISFSQFSIGKNSWDKERCKECNNFNSVAKFQLNIRSYKDIMFLLNIKDRRKIPAYYRNFLAHDEIQYRGNCILNNVHPYARLTDPCSERHPNGMTIGVFMCNSCDRKYKERAAEFAAPFQKEIYYNQNREVVDYDKSKTKQYYSHSIKL